MKLIYQMVLLVFALIFFVGMVGTGLMAILDEGFKLILISFLSGSITISLCLILEITAKTGSDSRGKK